MLHIQIVRRLVQQQDIWLFQKQFPEQYLRSLSAAQIRYIAVQPDVGQPQRTSDFLHLRIDGIKIVVHQKILDRSQLFHHHVHLILRCLAQMVADFIHLHFQLKQEGKCALQNLADRHAFFQHRVLIQIADAHPLRPLYFSLVRLHMPGNNIHKRRFTLAVRTDQTDVLTL